MAALDTDMVIIFSERMSQLHHNGKGNVDFFGLNLRLDRPGQPFIIRHGILQRGRIHHNIQRPVIIVKTDTAFPELILAILEDRNFPGRAEIRSLHAAAVGRCNIRHKHGAVKNHLTVAAQAPAGFEFCVRDMTALDGIQLTFNELDAAFSAGSVAGTGGIDGHIGPAGQLQQIVTCVAFHLNRVSTLNLEGYFHSNSSFRWNKASPV